VHLLVAVLLAVVSAKRNNNVLLILADDLGYGDTSVPPFIGLPVKTPNLQRMAENGLTLTNYHTAAATCTPTRASILTGMYPWRIGIKAVYEYGERGKSNRDDWLPPVPTIPMVLSEANYSVHHSGKWHLGGMRLDDLTLRTLPESPPTERGGKRCPHPGPNQQGFQTYVSVLDGPGSPRQNQLQIHSRLYSAGCQHLIKNDVHLVNGNITGYLSYCEAEHAIRAMEHSVVANQPFYIQVWFHCPHGPLEEIPGWRHLLGGRGPKNLDEVYITMIADMDVQVGRLLKRLGELGIEKDTLVMFTSDNGPEDFAGTTAGLRGRKRHLYEGGIRVPAIMQWPGTLPANKKSDAFVVSTDLFPTFLDAAGVRVPKHIRIDGLSVLPLLVPDYYTRFPVTSAPDSTTTMAATSAAGATQPVLHSGSSATTTFTSKTARHGPDEIREDPEAYRTAMRDRVTLWHNDYEGPRRTAAWVYDYKVILNENDVMGEMYDMKNDHVEQKNLLANYSVEYWGNFTFSTANGHHVVTATPAMPLHGSKVTLEKMLNDRTDKELHLWIAAHMYRVLKDYATYGNSAHDSLMKAHPEWKYIPTFESDYRMVGKRFDSPRVTKAQLVQGSCKTDSCSCERKTASQVQTLPFGHLGDQPTRYLNPGHILDASRLLRLHHGKAN
jgi:hypothetical protein